MQEGQRVALSGVVVSAALAFLKITVGMISRSTALLADGFESLGDVLASGLVWLGLTWAAKPADWNHPYGHGRAETLSGLVVGLLLFCGGMAIAVESLVSAGSVQHVPASYAVWPLLISIAAKSAMVRLKWRAGRQLGSAALAADAMNDSVDIVSGVVALTALGLTMYNPAQFIRADHYGASVVGLIMMVTGIRVARRTGSELMDTMPEVGLVDRIREVAQTVPGVSGVEKVFARKTGLRHHVDLHLEVDPEMTVRASHDLGHRVEGVLLGRIPSVADVLVHIEPSNSFRYDGDSRNSPLDKLKDLTLSIPDTRVTHEPFGEVRMYFEGATDQLRAMTAGSLVLEPGMSPHPPHQHPEEEFLLIAEGSGEIQVGDDMKQVGSGAMMYCAGNKLHGITNTGSAPMLFYFYKWLA